MVRKIKTLVRSIIKIVRKTFVFAFRQIKREPKRAIISLMISIVFGIWLGPRAGILWLLFLLFLVYEWENRIIGVLAIVAIASCPLLLSFQQDDLAETMAVYAYFFFVITVTLQIVEYKRHHASNHE